MNSSLGAVFRVLRRSRQLFRTIVKTYGSGGLSGSIVSRLTHNSEYTSCTQSRASSRLRSKLYASAYIFPLNGKYICVNCSCVICTKTLQLQPSNHVPFATICRASLYVIRFSCPNLTTKRHFFKKSAQRYNNFSR